MHDAINALNRQTQRHMGLTLQFRIKPPGSVLHVLHEVIVVSQCHCVHK